MCPGGSAQCVCAGVTRGRPLSLGFSLLRPGTQQRACLDPLATCCCLPQARKGMFEGGIPVGAVLVVDGKIVGRCVSTAYAPPHRPRPARTHQHQHTGHPRLRGCLPPRLRAS